MNVKEWFGSLALAFRYALVFGILLALVLVLGIIKLLYNRRKLKKYASLPLSSATTSQSREGLQPNEKDEGALFGIRAIEAGYYGGVVQSRPGSLANSPWDSVADLSLNDSPRLRPTRTASPLSVSSSVLDLERFEGEAPKSPIGPIIKSPRLVSIASDSALDTNYARGKLPVGQVRAETRNALRPSTAQKMGRHSHEPLTSLLNLVHLSPDDNGEESHRSPNAMTAGAGQRQKFRHSETLGYLMGSRSTTAMSYHDEPSKIPVQAFATVQRSQLPTNESNRARRTISRASISSRASSRSSTITVRRANSPPPSMPSPPPPLPVSRPPTSATSYRTSRAANSSEPPIPAFPSRASVDTSSIKVSRRRSSESSSQILHSVTPPAFSVPNESGAEAVLDVPHSTDEMLSYNTTDHPLKQHPPRAQGVRQYAHRSLPQLNVVPSSPAHHAKSTGHLSLDMLQDEMRRSSFVFQLPDIDCSSLRFSMIFGQDSRRTSTHSAPPTIDSRRTSFSFVPTLSEYHGYSRHESEGRRQGLPGDLSSDTSSTHTITPRRPARLVKRSFSKQSPPRLSFKNSSRTSLV